MTLFNMSVPSICCCGDFVFLHVLSFHLVELANHGKKNILINVLFILIFYLVELENNCSTNYFSVFAATSKTWDKGLFIQPQHEKNASNKVYYFSLFGDYKL